MILLVDNYDSFTYNLAHLFGELGAEVVVRRNDAIDADEAERLAPSHLVVSPGPGRPEDAGASVEIVRRLAPRCRRSASASATRRSSRPSAARSARRSELVHGKASASSTTAAGSSPGLPRAVRGRPLPLARRDRGARRASRSRRRCADGEVMAVRHRELPVDGVQFHPESVLTPVGPQLARNFLEGRGDDPAGARAAARRPRPLPRRGARGHGRDHGGRGDAGADRRLPRRAAAEGRDRRRDRRLRRGDARARARGAARSATTSSTPRAPAATARARSTSRPRRRWSRPRPARASPSTATARSPRPRARPTCSRRSASSSSCRRSGSSARSTSSASASCSRPTHHPAMRHAAPVRRELATRTVFNVLGPLTNPAGARAQVVGVYAPALVPTIAEVLAQLGARRAFVVHGAGGIDELSPAGPNLVCEVVDGDVHEREIDPLDLGVAALRTRGAARRLARARTRRRSAPSSRARSGGRRATRSCSTRPARSPRPATRDDLREGLELAREAVDSGAAARAARRS